jgi:hypothetical protein
VRLIRLAFPSLLFFTLPMMPLAGKSRGSLRSTVDQDYISALATADRFLQAWQSRDEEAGILLLTDRVRQRTSQEAVQDFFFSDPITRESFEIGRGRKLGSNRYQFPVTLFHKPSGHAHKWMHPRTSALVVVRAGSDWAIDQLP